MQTKEKSLLNIIGEFRDKQFEKEYFDVQINASKKNIKYLILFFGMLYFSITFYDYAYYFSSPAYKFSFLLRFIVLIYSIVIFLFINRGGDNNKSMQLIAGFNFLTLISYITLLYLLDARSFLSSFIAILIILQAVSLIPNRLIHSILIIISTMVVYIVTAKLYMPYIEKKNYIEVSIYAAIFCSFFIVSGYQINTNKRLQYYQNKELRRISNMDKLTEIYNRTKFDTEMDYWCNYSRRYDNIFSVIFYDIDHFKKINDTKGHQVGDTVLIKTTDVVRKIIRNEDIFARWGGEEFVILLPNTSMENATKLAERIRQSIMQHDYVDVNTVTVSVGVVIFEKNDTSDTIMKRADELMYTAKSGGRNMVVCEQKALLDPNTSLYRGDSTQL